VVSIAAHYAISRRCRIGKLWIQVAALRGVPSSTPAMAPALNKGAWLKWDRRYAYVSSTPVRCCARA